MPRATDNVVQDLEARLTDAQADLAAAQEKVERYTAALEALTGERQAKGSYRGTTGAAILAAAATFTGPMTTQTLLDHPDLARYSRHTLRSALTQLRRDGRIEPLERTSGGYVWKPLGS
jgi:hypothetical protein